MTFIILYLDIILFTILLLIFLFIFGIIKLIILVSIILINNLLQVLSNNYILGIQRYKKKLTNLAKIFINEVKYRNKNNSFIFKLTIFHNICAKADISHKIKFKVLITIFIYLALNYYYSNVSISIAKTFNKICNLI